MTRQETINSLKEIVSFFDRNPEIPMPDFNQTLYVHPYNSKAQLQDVIDKLENVLVRPLKKFYSDYFGGVFLEFHCMTVCWVCNRAVVCKAEEFETITVPAEPAREAYTYQKPTKWKCLPLIKEEVE